MRRILFLARAEALHVVRDRTTLAQVLILPILQLLVLSNAATFQIRNTPMYVVDFDRSTASRGLVKRFAASGHFRVDGQSASLDLANEALLRGDVTMVLTVPQDFEASLARTGSAPIQLARSNPCNRISKNCLGQPTRVSSYYPHPIRSMHADPAAD